MHSRVILIITLFVVPATLKEIDETEQADRIITMQKDEIRSDKCSLFIILSNLVIDFGFVEGRQ